MLWGNGWFCHRFGGFFWLNFHGSKRKDPSCVLFFNEQPPQPFWRIFAKSGYWIPQFLSWVLTIPAVWQMSWLHSLADFRFSMWNVELPDPCWSNGCVGSTRQESWGFFFPLFWPLLGFWIYSKYQTYKASCGSSTARFLVCLEVDTVNV